MPPKSSLRPPAGPTEALSISMVRRLATCSTTQGIATVTPAPTTAKIPTTTPATISPVLLDLGVGVVATLARIDRALGIGRT